METNYQKYSKKDLVKLLIKRDAEVDKTVDLLRRNDVSLSSLFEDVEEYVIDVFDNVLEGKIEGMRRCLDDMRLLVHSGYVGEEREVMNAAGDEYNF